MLTALGGDPRQTAATLGAELGRVGRAILECTELRRLVAAGGDISGQVARALGIEALAVLTPWRWAGRSAAPAPRRPPSTGWRWSSRGQVGAADYFGWVLRGQ